MRRGCGSVSSTGDFENSKNPIRWPKRWGGISRLQYQSPFLDRRSQERGTSTSIIETFSILLPCRRTAEAAKKSDRSLSSYIRVAVNAKLAEDGFTSSHNGEAVKPRGRPKKLK
jgi:hypothetical protein